MIEAVLPVHDAEPDLPRRLDELRRFLDEWFPDGWRLTVVDSADADAMRRAAGDLAGDDIRVRHLPRKGRGLAMRTVLTESEADVVVFLDPRQAGELDSLAPMVFALVLGHCDVAVAARPAHAARFPRVRRGVRAVRTAAVRPVLDRVGDDGWLFDTELLLVAEREGLRVHEVPVAEDEEPARPRVLLVAAVVALTTVVTALLAVRAYRRLARVRRPPVPYDDRSSHRR